jgi:hypothetical protein
VLDIPTFGCAKDGAPGLSGVGGKGTLNSQVEPQILRFAQDDNFELGAKNNRRSLASLRMTSLRLMANL